MVFHFTSTKILILLVVSAPHEFIKSPSTNFREPDNKFEVAEMIISTCRPKHKMWTKTG